MFGVNKLMLSRICTRLSGKKNFTCAKSAVIYKQSSIVNNLGDVAAINVGEHSHIKGELLTFGHGGRITIGDYCFVGEYTRVWSAKDIVIGDRVLISHCVNIFDNATHPLSGRARHEQFKSIITLGHPKSIDLNEQPVRIGNDAWIGCMAIILGGVNIGEGAVIGAGSVVTKDVAPYTIVAGNPARLVREIPQDER